MRADEEYPAATSVGEVAPALLSQPNVEEAGVSTDRVTVDASQPPRKLAVAVNPGIIDKNVPDHRLFAEGWMDMELTIEELVEAIRQGHAYCAQHNGTRRSANFRASDIASVDIDRGLTLEEALADPFVAQHAAFIYTTASHRSDAQRFRIVFELPRTITKASEMAAVMRALALRLGGDPAATDATRIFFGNRAAEFRMLGNVVDLATLDELAAQGSSSIAAERIKGGARSTMAVSTDASIRLSDGRHEPLSSIERGQAVFCPMHHDRNASAFIVQSRNGKNGLRCSTCAQTYWPAAEAEEAFEFNDFEHAVKRADRAGGAIGKLEGVKITIVDGQPASTWLLPGLNFIKSAKGTGKTHALRRYVHGVKKVLLISHRRALIRSIARRLNLHCYLDRHISPRFTHMHDGEATTLAPLLEELAPENRGVSSAQERVPWLWEDDPRLKRFAVSIDSLDLVPANMDYDLIILDESEQVLRHFVAETLNEKGGERDALFVRFEHLVSRAEAVVAADADLGWLSFDTLSGMMRRAERESPFARSIWINTHKPGKGKVVEMFAKEAHLVGELTAALRKGKKCFVASAAKSRVEKLAKAKKLEMPNLRILEITADTNNRPEVRDFVNNPAAAMHNYDLVLASPTIGTGVDITFPDNAQIVDCVFGFCDADVVTHLDFDQQIGRVRHPGRVMVWITPRKLSYETNEGAVRQEILETNRYGCRLVGFDPITGAKRFNPNPDPFIDMATTIDSQRRASLNDLRRNFIRHKEREGFEIRWHGEDLETWQEGLALLRLGKSMSEAEKITRLMDSAPLKLRDFKSVRRAVENEGRVTDENRLRLGRTYLELFYREVASEELLRLDQAGKFRDRIEMSERVAELLEKYGEVAQPDLTGRQGQRNRVLQDREQAALMILHLLKQAAVISDRRFNEDREFCAADLGGFVQAVRHLKGTIETLLGGAVQRDFDRKPVQVLGIILKKIGLKLNCVRIDKASGGVTRFYKLDSAALGVVHRVLRQRQEGGWEALARIHGWSEEDIYDEDEDR